VLVLGGPGVIEAVEARGATVVAVDGEDDEPDVVLVGLDRQFDYRRLDRAQRAIRNGARFVATNDDATFPTPRGLIPGGGAIVAAIATASGTQPVIAGKPHAPMAALVRERCGPDFSARTALMVGDRWSTDGAFARALDCPFALVRSGVTPPGAEVDQSAIDAPDLAAVARITRVR
jgi:ribonucleotide monophosphatase NagD (HAD superfamily)